MIYEHDPLEHKNIYGTDFVVDRMIGGVLREVSLYQVPKSRRKRRIVETRAETQPFFIASASVVAKIGKLKTFWSRCDCDTAKPVDCNRQIY